MLTPVRARTAPWLGMSGRVTAGTAALPDAPHDHLVLRLDDGTVIRAVVPQAELYGYASSISSMTQGHARFKRHFKGYEEAPHEVAARVIEAHAKERDEEVVAH